MIVPEVTLEETCEFLSGFAWSATKFNTSSLGIPIIRIQNVDASRDKDFIYWDEPYEERFVIEKDDLLLTLSGSFRVGLWDGPSALLNQRIVKLIPKKNVTPEWLLHVLRHRIAKISNLGRHALVSNVALADLRKFSVPLPSLPEQRRIAAILDQADTLRAKRREALAQLDSLTQSIFIEMFGDPKSQIEDGVCRQLSDVVAPGRIVTYGIVQAGPEVSDGVPYIRTGDIKNGVILEERLSKTSHEIAASYSRSAINTGDIVMSIRATVGTTALVPESLNGANLTQGTARISPGDGVRTEYLLSYLRNSSVQGWIQSNVKGATFREITLGKLRQLPVFIPSIDLQNKFVERISVLNSLVTKAQQSLAEMHALFVSLQHRAFRGEL